MAKIIIMFIDEGANTTDSFETTLTDATLDRIIDVGRNLYGTKSPTPGDTNIVLASKNFVRKKYSKEMVRYIKNTVLNHELDMARSTQQPLTTTDPP